MPSDTRQLQQVPSSAEKPRAVLAARVSGVYGRLRRFRERYEAQLTPAERRWLRLTCAELERYRATLASPGHTRPGGGRALGHRPRSRS
jgi:hypothetical protein